jgi:hypothetical protein
LSHLVSDATGAAQNAVDASNASSTAHNVITAMLNGISSVSSNVADLFNQHAATAATQIG